MNVIPLIVKQGRKPENAAVASVAMYWTRSHVLVVTLYRLWRIPVLPINDVFDFMKSLLWYL